MQFLIIDSNVPDLDQVVSSLEDNVTHYVYTHETADQIISSINAGLTGNQELNLGFMYTNRGYERIPFFPDPVGATGNESVAFSHKCRKFLQHVGLLTNLYTLDLITCKDNYPYSKYEMKIGGTIRYSDNDIGSASLGGNYVLSSTGTNLIGLYFKDTILSWNHVLDGDDITLDLPSGVKYDSSKKLYKLVKDVKWPSNSHYGDSTNYINLVSGDVFDGQGYTIDFGLTNLSCGFLRIVNVEKRVTIKNLIVRTNISNNYSGNGGSAIVRAESSNFKIYNSKVIGNILGNNCGGFIGGYCTNYTCENCEFVGDVVGQNAGGIAGYRNSYIDLSGETPANVNNKIVIKNAKTKGNIIGDSSAGILGSDALNSYCSNTSGEFTNISTNVCEIENNEMHGDLLGSQSAGIVAMKLCYIDVMNSNSDGNIKISTNVKVCHNKYSGKIYGSTASGIVGEYSYYSNTCGSNDVNVVLPTVLTVKNCKVKGDLIGDASAGIVGYQSNGNTSLFDVPNSSFTIENCGYEGDLIGQCYGIVGSRCGDYIVNGDDNVVLNIKHCSVKGTLIGGGSAGIVGQYGRNIAVENCYTEGDIFNDTVGILGIRQIADTITLTNCYASGHIRDPEYGYGIYNGAVSVALTQCYARDNSGTDPLSLLKGSIDRLPASVWEKVKHKYPVFRKNK